jgi:2-haloacid dehalogenase
VRSVAKVLNRQFLGRVLTISTELRAEKLEYTRLCALSDQYEDFWKVTESVVFACNNMKLRCDKVARGKLMDTYLHLETFPEVKQAVKSKPLPGPTLVIPSNGTVRIL